MELHDTLTLLPGWEDRYAYLIDLGRALPPMPDALKTDAVLVPGCTSRVWLLAETQTHNALPTFHFTIDSDAAIVKGLCAVLMIYYQDKTASEIASIDICARFGELGLAEHLTPNRRNGFFAMVERLRHLSQN